MKPYSLIITISILVTLGACGTIPSYENDTQPPTLGLQSDLFGNRPDIISVPAIHELSNEQRLRFLRYFDDPRNKRTPAHLRLFNYLEAVTSDFSFRGDTYTASETLKNSAGNCLSLAILTTALVRLTDVDIAYQLTDTAPVFESRGTVINRGLHVRSMLYDPTWASEKGAFRFSRPGIKVDYFPSDRDRFIGNIRESEYFAMYFQNVAADAIEDQKLATAYWLLLESLELSPHNPDSLNMLAIIFDRADDKRMSEEIYLYGIRASDRQVSLLRNYGLFLRRQGRPSEAEKIDKKLAELNDPNPFDWLYAGRKAYRDGNYGRAIRFFRKTVELAPYLHEGHFRLARAHLQIGNLTAAEREMELALSHANRNSTRNLYSAKLAVLKQR